MGLFDLIFRLGTDNRGFNRGIDQARQRASSAAAEMGHAFKHHLAAIFSAAAIEEATRKTIEYASNIKDLSEASGIAAETVQELDYAMRKNGATIEDAINAARALSRARAEALADPGGDKARLFEQFGISRDELQSLNNAGDLLKRFSDAVKGASVDANSLPKILELISSGAHSNMAAIPALIAGLRELGDEAHKAGLVMKEGMVDELHEIGVKFTELGKRITVGLAPILTWVADRLKDTVDLIKATIAGLQAAFAEFRELQKSPTPRSIGFKASLIGDAFGRAFNHELVKIVEEDEARALARNKSRPGLDIDVEAGGAGQKELNRLREQIEAAQRATRFAGLNPEQKRAELQKELQEARLANRNFGLNDRPGLDQGRIDLRIAKAEQALAEFDQRSKRDSFGDALLKPSPGDSLTSIGNFLGTNPAAETNSTLKRVEQTLMRIDHNTARTADNGIVLE